MEALIYGSADLDDFFKRDHNVFSIGIAGGYVQQRLPVQRPAVTGEVGGLVDRDFRVSLTQMA